MPKTILINLWAQEKHLPAENLSVFAWNHFFWGDFQEGSFHICSIKRVLEQKMDKLFDDGSEHSASALSKYSKKKKKNSRNLLALEKKILLSLIF